jgi:plasmid maintenance system antidote protein VapI
VTATARVLRDRRGRAITRGRVPVAPAPTTNLRLAKFFEVSPDFWMNLQLRWDLYQARVAEAREIESICTYRAVVQPA